MRTPQSNLAISCAGLAFAGTLALPLRFPLATHGGTTMADYKETHEVKTDTGSKGSSATPWLAFFVGALLIAVVAIFFMNAQGSFRGPTGRVDFNVKSPVTQPANPAPSNPEPG